MTEMKSYQGYHGTSKASADSIDKGNFKIDFQKFGWLGSGIYFFQSNSELADYWSQRKFASKGLETALFEVLISIPAKRVFDVSDPLGEDNKYYQAVRKKFIEQEVQKRGIRLTVKNREELDGKAYNLICIKDRYELVRGVTITPDDQDRTHGLHPHTPNGVELCLRNIGHIAAKRIMVREGGKSDGS